MKRGVASSSQTSCEEGAEDEGEETTSPPEGKGPLDAPGEQRAKRAHQTTFLEANVNLQRPLGEVLKEGECVQPGMKAIPTVKAKLKVLKKAAPARGASAMKAVEAKKDAEAKLAEVTRAKEAAEGESAKAAKTKETAEAEATSSVAGQERAAAKGAKASTGSGPAATGAAPHKERRSKLAGDPALAKEPTPSELGAAEGARKDASTDAIVRGTSSEEVMRRAAAYPVPLLSFAEMHRALGDLHVREMNELGAEIRRLNAKVEEAATKNCQLISIGKACEKALAQARVGYVAEAEVAAKIKKAVDRANATERAAKRAQSEVDKLAEVLNDYVETATPKECLQTATTRVIECAADILAALQYLSPREHLPHDAQSVFKAVSDVPVVVDWLRRSACRVGATMALSMVLAHYPEGLDLEEVTAGFPSETGEFDMAEVLWLMGVVRPYVDRVLAVADLESHQVSMTVPEDLDKAEQKPQDFPADRLFAAAASKGLTTYPVAKYTPKFKVGEGGAAFASEEGPSGSK
ncbi:hypothetical protein ACQ4PT_067605 [Festuca glaucescens]